MNRGMCRSFHRYFGLVAIGCAVAGIANTARAEEESPWTLWLGGGGIFFEADDENESGQLYEARLGYDIDPSWTVEGGLGGAPFLEGNDFNAPDPREATFDGKNSPGENWSIRPNVNLLYHVDGLLEDEWDPYVSLGGGVNYFGKRREDTNWEPYGGGGVGVAYKVNEDLDLRLDYQVAAAGTRVDINHYVLGLVHYNWDNLLSGGEGKGGDADDELGARSSSPLSTVYFDFDSSKIKPEEANKLKQNAQWMKANPDKKVSLEGHADERGTSEYNMALGQRRAASAQKYLRSLGIPENQSSLVSYGEEFPADPGHNEAAWAKNRRTESLIKK